ncbi:MAG: M23 family metallopeptidase [Nitrospirae bacterium]|nr:M23 family metallopeptidase [Nitrospirota bacterium]MBF0541753.1 M23 family metallopeptidase [Nitrospirota bacterium]
MKKIKKILVGLFSPITVMIVPHNNNKPINIKMPSVGLILIIALWASFTVFLVSVGKTTIQYYEQKEKIDFYYNQFLELGSTIKSLQRSETQFRQIFAFKSREKILENIDDTAWGSLDPDDMKRIKAQIEETANTVGEIRDYLKQERDIYFATPLGSPISNGYISSPFGWRIHPVSHREEYHKGLDIAAWPGTPVKATADGIVVFADNRGGSGNLVIIAHGLGFSTCYAHNRKILVDVGQKVKRGDVISLVGSTGDTTGPHVHYEVWVNKNPVDPEPYYAKRIER